jgi:hypothetical protein
MAVVLAAAGAAQPVTEPRTELAAVPPNPARKARRVKSAEVSLAMSASSDKTFQMNRSYL